MVFDTFIFSSINTVHACLIDDSKTTPRTECFTHDSIALSYGVAILMSMVCFLCSVITNNDSWVDRFWSIIPVVCAWIHVLFPENGKLTIPKMMTTQIAFALVITLWGIRLTYNFYRKGGYRKGGEDYRWNYVRTWRVIRHPAVWPFFSLFIISTFQVFLLVAIAIPVAQLPSRRGLNGTDTFFLLGQCFWLLLESAADQQQWEFHQYKLNKSKQAPLRLQADCERGFLTRGLFSFSRHPNVVCEQIFWVNVFFASTAYAGFTASCVGCASLVALTNYSCLLTEEISGKKYPLYSVYKKCTPFLYPSPMSTRWDIDRNMPRHDLQIRGIGIHPSK